jgi:hypothetical protein
VPSEQIADEPWGTMMVSRGGEFELMQLARLRTPARATAAKERDLMIFMSVSTL